MRTRATTSALLVALTYTYSPIAVTAADDCETTQHQFFNTCTPLDPSQIVDLRKPSKGVS